MWFFAILAVLVLAGAAVVAAGRGQPLAEADDDNPRSGLPDGPLGAEDLRRVRFPLALRGYRMADVDALLARLGDQLGEPPGDVPGDVPGDPPSDPTGGPADLADGGPKAP